MPPISSRGNRKPRHCQGCGGTKPKENSRKRNRNPLDSEQDAPIMNIVHVAEKQAPGVVWPGVVGAWGWGSLWPIGNSLAARKVPWWGFRGGKPGRWFGREALEGSPVKEPGRMLWKEILEGCPGRKLHRKSWQRAWEELRKEVLTESLRRTP